MSKVKLVLMDGAMDGFVAHDDATLQKFSKIVLNVHWFGGALLLCLHKCVHLSDMAQKIVFTETTFYLNYKCVLLDSLLRYCLMVDRGPVGPLLDGRLPIVESEMLSAESVYILCHSLAMK